MYIIVPNQLMMQAQAFSLYCFCSLLHKHEANVCKLRFSLLHKALSARLCGGNSFTVHKAVLLCDVIQNWLLVIGFKCKLLFYYALKGVAMTFCLLGSLHPFTWLSRRPKSCRLLYIFCRDDDIYKSRNVFAVQFVLFFSLEVFVLPVRIWRNYGK